MTSLKFSSQLFLSETKEKQLMKLSLNLDNLNSLDAIFDTRLPYCYFVEKKIYFSFCFLKKNKQIPIQTLCTYLLLKLIHAIDMFRT